MVMEIDNTTGLTYVSKAEIEYTSSDTKTPISRKEKENY